jgi:alkylation response protein AidB-like acyl-CoA dehydrogenase
MAELVGSTDGIEKTQDASTSVVVEQSIADGPSDAKDSGQQMSRLLRRTQRLADEIASRPNLGLTAAPLHEIERCREAGLLLAPFPKHLGGMGLGVEPGTQLTLMRCLAAIGGADLALGRILEGHWNGLLLVLRFGSPEQIETLAAEVRAGKLSGVWNTGARELLHLHPDGERFRFQGVKTFATGAAFVTRPVVTAEIPHRGWQMTLPHMESLGATIDRSFWHPLGMESSESFGVDFSGGFITGAQLIGSTGDFYRDPMFRGGAIRFASVQAGAILRMQTTFADWLEENRRTDDPYQVARMGELSIAAQEAALWVEKAAAVAESCFYQEDPLYAARMIDCASMMRTAIERLATRAMQLVTAGVGAHGLLQPYPFERMIRDLTMYLRQPAPDATLASIGRSAFAKTKRAEGGPAAGFWSGDQVTRSLPSHYFQRIYNRERDPWSFETSEYERNKYDATLRCLPHHRYRNTVEVGCSIGVLTERLSHRTNHLLGLDVSERALEEARERLASSSHVEFACMQVPFEMPEGSFDLVVISEVAYYWQHADLEDAATAFAERQPAGGTLMLVHLTEHVPDYPLTGDEVHNYWLSRKEWKHTLHERHPRFRIDVLERA